MPPLNRPSFTEFLVSPAASLDAQNASKNAVFFGLASAAFVGFARPWDFGLGWFLVLPALAFAVSILFAVPIWFGRMAAAWSNWSNPRLAKALTFAIDLIGLGVYVAGTYYGLRTLWFWIT